ncbi:MAG: ribosome silencing factor [Actinomycetota bacterium]|nr:ribosome silencing factor [Actinomycetota bacterium]
MTARELVMVAAQAADDKKATDIIILEMAGILDITDYFLICGGATDRQTKAIADEIQKRLRDFGCKPHRSAGEELGDWILLDYVDFIIHIFTDETREYYRLERLWKDAPQLKMKDVKRSQAR